jgi:hypothetical protein
MDNFYGGRAKGAGVGLLDSVIGDSVIGDSVIQRPVESRIIESLNH